MHRRRRAHVCAEENGNKKVSALFELTAVSFANMAPDTLSADVHISPRFSPRLNTSRMKTGSLGAAANVQSAPLLLLRYLIRALSAPRSFLAHRTFGMFPHS
jgi:hypothetical protein